MKGVLIPVVISGQEVEAHFPIVLAFGNCNSKQWMVEKGRPYLVFSVVRLPGGRLAHRFDERTGKMYPPVPLYLLDFTRAGIGDWMERETNKIAKRLDDEYSQ